MDPLGLGGCSGGKRGRPWLAAQCQAQPYSRFRELQRGTHQARGTPAPALSKHTAVRGKRLALRADRGPIASIWGVGGGVVAFKTQVRRGRPGRHVASLASPARRVHFHVERGASQAPLSPRRRRRRGSAGAGAPGSLPPSLPSFLPSLPLPRPPAARAFVWPGGALGASRAGSWRPEEANGPARPPLMSGRSRRESAAGRGAGEGVSVAARPPRMAVRVPTAPSRAVAGTGAPRDVPSPIPHPLPRLPQAVPGALQLPCGRAKASGCPRAAPSSPEKCQGLNARAGGPRSGLPEGFAALQGTPAAQAALGQGHWGEGMPPGSDARVLT